MGQCKICGFKSPLITNALSICLNCLRNKPEECEPLITEAHLKSKDPYGLPPTPPKDMGIKCPFCANECMIPVGGTGYCGLTVNVDGRLKRLAGTPEKGVLEWYYDPLPTNCVSAWVCPGCTGVGYPKYAVKPSVERGYSNLAVFYGSCSLDCLYCQNWTWRELASRLKPTISSEKLAEKAHKRVTCICYFGGDPSTQMPHSLSTSKKALEIAQDQDRILRICWETNGLINPNYLKQAINLALESGGNIKIDFKAINETIYKALCGASNKPVLKNITKIAEKIEERSEVPLLTASTLLVPGYIDEQEVYQIAKFLADLNPEIPYSLLAFYPTYLIDDLPTTSYSHAQKCLQAARKAGLKNVKIGNIHLLSHAY